MSNSFRILAFVAVTMILSCSNLQGQITPVDSRIFLEAAFDVNPASQGDDLFDSFELEPPNSSFGSLLVDEIVQDEGSAGAVGVRSRISYSDVMYGDILTDSVRVLTDSFGQSGNQAAWFYRFEVLEEVDLTLYWSSGPVINDFNGGINTNLAIRDAGGFFVYLLNTTEPTSGIEEITLAPGTFELELSTCQCSMTGSFGVAVQEWRTRFQWGFAGFEPGSENNPYLPVNTTDDDETADQFVFDIPPSGTTGMQFIDPLAAIGYRYNITDNFATEVMIPAPLPNGDSDFFITVGDQTAPITAGVPFDFESNFGITNVAYFEITGINADEELDPEDQLAFVTGITFADETVSAGVTMTPLILGDVNCDGEINLLDVAPFVDAISSGEFHPKADINDDGVINLLDVDPFIELLSGH